MNTRAVFQVADTTSSLGERRCVGSNDGLILADQGRGRQHGDARDGGGATTRTPWEPWSGRWPLELSEQVGCRLRRHGLKGRTVNLKVRFEDFHTITCAQTLPQPTNVTQEIWQTADQTFAERLPARRLHIRLLGVGMSGFDHPAMVQSSLFPEVDRERQSHLDEVADKIKERFGQAGLQRALGMLHDVEQREQRPGADRGQYGK
jgi:hypothetical protein